MQRPFTSIITGATSGIGEACARRFAKDKRSARLLLTGRRTERLSQLKQDIENLGGDHQVLPLTLDVRDRKSVEDAFSSLPPEFSIIDVLVNNAGLALGVEPAHLCSIEKWDQMIDTNIKGVLYVTKCILPGMVKQKRGHIVNIGSVAGSYPYPGGNVYGGTKAFIEMFSLNLRADLVDKNVRVTSIEPGLTETEFSKVRFDGDEEKAGKVYLNTKPMTGEDIAEAVSWVVDLPNHVNVNRIELMATCQAFNNFNISRSL